MYRKSTRRSLSNTRVILAILHGSEIWMVIVNWDGTGDGREVDRMYSLTLGYAAAVGALNA
jgi:hypothetical protein